MPDLGGVRTHDLQLVLYAKIDIGSETDALPLGHKAFRDVLGRKRALSLSETGAQSKETKRACLFEKSTLR